jgi:hypothetical protein
MITQQLQHDFVISKRPEWSSGSVGVRYQESESNDQFGHGFNRQGMTGVEFGHGVSQLVLGYYGVVVVVVVASYQLSLVY